MKKVDFKKLIDKYLQGDASEEEIDLLFCYYDAMQENGVEWDDSEMGDQDVVHKALYSRILKDIDRKSRLRSKNWTRVAAAILVLLSISLFFVWTYTKTDQQPVDQIAYDIPPGGNRAILTLADGSTVLLNDTKNGVILNDKGLKITKTVNGQLIYEVLNVKGGLNTGVPSNNTIATPKGGQFQVILPDGTKVWLNAASSLKYPTSFDVAKREVELKGEAYFEVSKCLSKVGRSIPFFVKIKTQSGDAGEVEVLGTHFNIMAYDDEKMVSTTLLEGSVRIKKGGDSKLLKPGQQSQSEMTKNSSLTVIDDVNTEEIMAWKNEQFEFNNVDIATILRQVARWYDVEVITEGDLPDEPFRGKISRNANISQVLKVLKLNGVNLKTEGRKIIVKP